MVSIIATLIILFIINHLFTDSKVVTCIEHFIILHTVTRFQVLLCITNNSIKYQSLVYTQLNDQTVLFLTIQFSISQQS